VEVWKDIIGYKNRYQVSSLGRVFSKRSNRTIRGSSNQKGYISLDARGAALRFAKLKTKEVLEIRKLLRTSMKHKDIAKKYNITCVTISNINTRKSWKHI